MELRIKTYDEVSSERVTIEVSPGQKVEIQMVDSSPSTIRACEGPGCPNMADVREESVRSDYGLREEADRLKRELAEVMSQRNQYQRDLTHRTAEVRRLEAGIQGLKARHQRELADLRDKITEEAQKAETFKAQAYGENDKVAVLRTQLAASRKVVTNLTIRNQQALRILSTEQVESDMQEGITKLADRLAEAIKAAREELRGTLQA